MGNDFNQFSDFIRTSARKLQIANRFKTIDQLLLKQCMTLADLIESHVTTNSTACYGYSSWQSSLKIKLTPVSHLHGPCQMQRHGAQIAQQALTRPQVMLNSWTSFYQLPKADSSSEHMIKLNHHLSYNSLSNSLLLRSAEESKQQATYGSLQATITWSPSIHSPKSRLSTYTLPHNLTSNNWHALYRNHQPSLWNRRSIR